MENNFQFKILRLSHAKLEYYSFMCVVCKHCCQLLADLSSAKNLDPSNF